MREVPNEPGSVTRAIQDAQHGEKGADAAAQLMRRYYAVVIGKANHRLRGVVVADASDVAIDVFDSIFRGLAKGRYACKDRQEFEELLGKVTYHKAIGLYHWIKTARRHPADKQSTEEILTSYPVKESHRRVAELYYIRGKSESEVAAELQISLKTVQESLSDVRCWLQRHRYRPTAYETQDALENVAQEECPLDVLILKELIESLDETIAETVRLLLQGLSPPEIAERLDVGERQVQRRLRLFKELLHNQVPEE